MKQYQDLLKTVLTEGNRQFNERTGQLMIGVAGHQSVYDLDEGFPLCTTKKVFFKGVAEELFWFLRGERNVKPLIDRGVNIWNRNAYDLFLRRNGLNKTAPKNTLQWEEGLSRYIERISTEPEFARAEGDLGPIYGNQWRHWRKRDGTEIDQIRNIIHLLTKEPGSRYAILNAWNPEDIPEMALAPCHCISQFNIFENEFVDVNMFQRSCDTFLGVPFNIASYALLNVLVARELGKQPRKFYHCYGNAHIYAGVSPRSEFLLDDSNLAELRQRIKGAQKPEDYLETKEWYVRKAPSEGQANERKDHIPFVLEQLSLAPKALPRLEIKSDLSLEQLITKPASEVLEITGYNPHKWDSSAVMAA